jgi:hypothetical protein
MSPPTGSSKLIGSLCVMREADEAYHSGSWLCLGALPSDFNGSCGQQGNG